MDTLRGDLGRYFCAWELCKNEKNSIIDTIRKSVYRGLCMKRKIRLMV